MLDQRQRAVIGRALVVTDLEIAFCQICGL
jgi:hypothetical protein